MLAIAHWTGQIPRRPPIPEGCSVNQLIALGSRRKRSKVYWMIAQSEKEVRYGIKVLILSLYSFLCFPFILSLLFFFVGNFYFPKSLLFQVFPFFPFFFYSFVFLDEINKIQIITFFLPFLLFSKFPSFFAICWCWCLSHNPVNG